MNDRLTLFNMLIMMHCILIRGRSKSTFSKYSFGRDGGHKTEYPVQAFENVDNSGRPLRRYATLLLFH